MASLGLTDLGAAVDELSTQQARVAELAQALRGQRWRRRPSPETAATLAGKGHFLAFAPETDWSASEVVGHLTDSARVFTNRIILVREQDNPWLEDFVPEEPSLVASYASRDEAAAISALDGAQRRLLATLSTIKHGDLERPATHEVDGLITLNDIVQFLPSHQQDHADQLECLFNGLDHTSG